MGSRRVRLTPVDGVDRVGGTTWHLQQGVKGCLIDFGSDLQSQGRLLGGRLRPRDGKGIGDHLDLGLIPRIQGALRYDLLLDPDRWDDLLDLDVQDLLLTHAHQDHSGRLFALDPSIRVHCTGVTAALLHAEATVSRGLAAETTHVVERAPHPTEHGLLHKPRGSERVARPILTVDGPPSADLRALWGGGDSEGGLGRSDLLAAGMPFRSFDVDHSVLGAAAYAVETDAGLVVHAGDLRRHGGGGYTTDAFARWLGRREVRALILEGTRVGRGGDERTTEEGCRDRIRELVAGAGRRLVVAAFPPRHLERLSHFVGAALRAKREMVVSARTMMAIEAVAAADPLFDLLRHGGLKVYDPPRLSRDGWHSALRERHKGSLVHPEEIRARPRRYVLENSLEGMDLVDVDARGALVIWSRSASHDDEGRGRDRRVLEWAARYGIEVAGMALRAGRVVRDPFLAPSGHCAVEDLRWILKRAQPEILVPCHSARPDLFTELVSEGTKTVVPQEGRGIAI